MSALSLTPQLQLPWESSREEDRRFYKILRNALAMFVVLAIAIPLLPLEEIAGAQQEETQPLTRVVLEEKLIPPPKPIPKPVKPKPQPTVEEVQKPQPVTPPKPRPAPKPEPVDTLAQARKAAAVAGVLAFQDDLQSLRDTVDVDSMNQTRTSRGASDAAQLQRSVVTSTAAADSGGIQTAALSTDTGGPALSGRKTTTVQSAIAGTAEKAKKPGGQDQSQRLGGRSDESIRSVMDKSKGAIFAIYNRALRKDPLLEGKLVFEMVIDPSGGIAELKLLSSELAGVELTRKILSRIKLIQFGAAQVSATRVNYSFDFLPYT